jgi:acetate---CoA ligase (ADP-forming)
MLGVVPDLESRILLGTFFDPKSVVVIGASTHPDKSGSRIVRNLLQNDFKGDIFCVNPRGGSLDILGKQFTLYPSVRDIPRNVDVAIVFVRNEVIPSTLEDCLRKGIKYAIIEAAGFEEIGDKGIELKERIRTVTRDFTAMRVVGPNCTGITSIRDDHGGFFSSFVPQSSYRRGIVAVISQSGMINGGFFLYLSTSTNIGFRHIAALGNKMDVNENDILEYYITDNDTKIVVLYLESIANAARLVQLGLLARANGKRVFMLKSGNTATARKAIQSHTGSLSGDARLVDAVAKQARITTCRSFYGLFQQVKCLDYTMESGMILPSGKGRVAIMTVSGGAACNATDLIEGNVHLQIARLSAARSGLASLYPDWMPVPDYGVVDLWPAVEKVGGDTTAVFKQALGDVLGDPGVDIVIMTYFVGKDYPFDPSVILDARDKHKKPVIVWLFGEGDAVVKMRGMLEKYFIPVYEDMDLAVDAAAALVAP